MNPLSLLTKGHTFGGVKDRRGAYKLPAGNVLPHFAGPKRPPPTTSRPAPEPSQTALFEPPHPAVEAAVSPKRDDAAPTAPKVAVKPPEDRPSPEGIWRRAARWWKEFLLRRKSPAGRARSVQTELALNKVTVVRNDLSEDDLEVVTVEKSAGLEKKTLKPAQSETVEPEKLMGKP
ncbi:MAG: hypothetical protein ABSH38_01355 [Verrucomicrobiota bacterium]|jgi:hypothetical protein